MKSFVLNNFIFLFIFCLIPAVQLRSQPVDKQDGLQQTWIPPLGKNFDKALFKVSLDISKIHLTGLLFIKQTSDTSTRIIFTNEMGMKYFDLEFFPEQLMIHYCFPSMARKSLLKIIEFDFRLLFPEVQTNEIKILSRHENPTTLEYKVRSKSGRFIYTISRESHNTLSILTSGKLFEKNTDPDHTYGKCSSFQDKNPQSDHQTFNEDYID